MLDTTLPASVAAALSEPQPGTRIRVDAAAIPFSALTWGEPSQRPLVMLHGVTSSAATWWRIGPALAATGRYVVAVDLPGHGLTGSWRGHHRFADNARDIAAFIREAGLGESQQDGHDLQVIGHSYGAMTAAELPGAGVRPATIVLVDPPAVSHAVISLMLADPDERTYDRLDEATMAIRATNPDWTERDVLAKAESLTQLDEGAARAILLDNGDWDGGLAALEHPALADVDVWLIRSDPAEGGYIPDDVVPAFDARLGSDHVITLTGAPHSPHRLRPEATTAALVRALDGSAGDALGTNR